MSSNDPASFKCAFGDRDQLYDTRVTDMSCCAPTMQAPLGPVRRALTRGRQRQGVNGQDVSAGAQVIPDRCGRCCGKPPQQPPQIIVTIGKFISLVTDDPLRCLGDKAPSLMALSGCKPMPDVCTQGVSATCARSIASAQLMDERCLKPRCAPGEKRVSACHSSSRLSIGIRTAAAQQQRAIRHGYVAMRI